MPYGLFCAGYRSLRFRVVFCIRLQLPAGNHAGLELCQAAERIAFQLEYHTSREKAIRRRNIRMVSVDTGAVVDESIELFINSLHPDCPFRTAESGPRVASSDVVMASGTAIAECLTGCNWRIRHLQF